MRFLLAVDGSDDALEAAGFIGRLGLEEGDEIDIVHVLEEVWGIRKSFKDFENIRRVREEFAERILSEAEDAVRRKGLTIRSVVLPGLAEEAILDYGARMDVDLIAMGATGFPEAPAVRLGSVTRKVVTGAAVPVLVGRRPSDGKAGMPLRVIFGTDGSPCSDKALAAMRIIPFPTSTEIVVLSAVDSVMRVMPERFSLELDDTVKASIAEARRAEIAEAEALVARYAEALEGPFHTVDTRVPLGEPTTEILEEAARRDAGLVVVGCRGLRGVKEMLGSVSRRILSQAGCSVLVSKMPG